MRKLSRKQLIWYGMAGIGPNLLNLMVGSYLCDALMAEGFIENLANWTYTSKTLIIVAVWSVIVTIAKIVDGVIDVPFGYLADNLKTKFGKRRPSLLFGIVLMVASYLLFLIVPSANKVVNTIWFGLWLMVFYSFYTLTMLTFYATFSEVTSNDSERVLLSNSKSAMDIIYFILGYALVPVLVDASNIRVIALLVMIFMVSMIIPFILIKERSTLDKDVIAYKESHPEDEEAQKEKHLNIFKSIAYTFKNKDFLIWMIIYGILQFGLSMYLTGFNVYYSGTMQFSGLKIMLCNVAAFGPVPATLILYNFLVKRKGFKFGFSYSLICFSIGMLFFVICREPIFTSETARLAFAMTGGVICSFGVGSFFSVSYTIPSHLAADEKAKTGISHPSMYFAIQGLVEAVISAISTGIVWINLKNIPAKDTFFLSPAGGSGLMTLFVASACVISCILTLIILPKSLRNLGMQTSDVQKRLK